MEMLFVLGGHLEDQEFAEKVEAAIRAVDAALGLDLAETSSSDESPYLVRTWSAGAEPTRIVLMQDETLEICTISVRAAPPARLEQVIAHLTSEVPVVTADELCEYFEQDNTDEGALIAAAYAANGQPHARVLRACQVALDSADPNLRMVGIKAATVVGGDAARGLLEARRRVEGDPSLRDVLDAALRINAER